MLAGRTIMAMLAVLLQMLAAGNSQATPDSGAILKSARRAQAAFESTRRASLPELSGGSPGGRTEIIGRITLSFESGGDDETVVPEPPRIRSARARLLSTFQEASAALPGDEWIAGQQVRYLIEDSQPQQAARVAQQCRAVRWWCDALMGLVRQDRKSTRLNSSHVEISYAVFCLKKKIKYVHYVVYQPNMIDLVAE